MGLGIKTKLLQTRRALRVFMRNRFYRKLTPEEVFRFIYQTNDWKGRESVSGEGSDLAQTQAIIAELGGFLASLGVKSMLDIPCGDFNWMAHVQLEGVEYIGADLLPELISGNTKYERPNRRFEVLDLLRSPLPKVDLILCRDCLVHFSNDYVKQALKNMQSSGSRYLLTTTFPKQPANPDIVTGHWRPVNLELPPFSLPAPLALIDEKVTWPDRPADKSLGLWRLQEISVERQDGGRTS